MNNIRLSVFQIPECPFLHVAVAGGIHLPACLFTTSNATHLPVAIQRAIYAWLSGSHRGHSSTNYLHHIHRALFFFLPGCLDMCRGVSQLSNYSIYIPGCHSLPWLEPFCGVFISGCVKILFFSGIGESEP